MLLKNFLIFIFILIGVLAKAGKTDSLLIKLKKAKEDTNKVILLNKIAREFLYKDPSVALAYVDTAETLSTRLNYLRGLSRALTTKGIYYRNNSEFDLAFKCHIEAIKLCEKTNDRKAISQNYTNLGTLFKNQGKYEQSIEYHLLSKKIFEEFNDKLGIANCLQNVSNTYRRMRNTEKALENAEGALKLFDEINNDEGRRSAYNAIANVYLEDKKDFKMALHYLLKMEALVDKLGDDAGKNICYLNLGSVYHNLKNFKLAEEYALKGLEISKKLKSLENVASGYKNLAEIYEGNSDLKKALYYHKEFYVLADSLNRLQHKRSTLELEEKFQSEKSKKEIELLSNVNDLKTKENEAQKSTLRKTKIIIAVFVLFGIIITSLMFLFYKNNQKTKKLNNLLTTKNDQIEYQKKEILDSILYARRIQDSILPTEEELSKTIPKHFIIYKPRDIVSGDFYWTYPLKLKDHKVAVVALCDCTGHGVPGAFMSLISYTVLNQTVKDPDVTGPDTVLNFLAKELPVALKSSGQSNDLRDGLDIALAGIDFENLAMECSMAHIPIYISDGKELRFIQPDKQSISANNYDPDFKFRLQKVQLKKGDRVFFATDGYADQFGGEKGKKLKYKQLEQLLLETHHMPLTDQKHKLENFFERWKGELEQVDDVTLIGIEV